MKSICVFCGSSVGAKAEYQEAAKELGSVIAGMGIRLIYGGANVGLMKFMADSALAAGGEVIGIMPRSLVEREVAHMGLSRLHIVENMGERKTMMFTLADAFIAMPGGFGTLDELAEACTYSQLRIADKPIGLLNTAGYFDLLLKFFDHAVAERFLREEHRRNIIIEERPRELIRNLDDFSPVTLDKWIHEIREESK